MDTKKVCTSCEIDKPLSEYTKAKYGRFGKTSKCKSCVAANHTIRLNKAKAAGKSLYRHDIKRRHILKKTYGLSEADYAKILSDQDGTCAICKLPEIGTSGVKRTIKALAVDHNHLTGTVRGLLCGMCNTALGLFKDDTRLLNAAVEYLERIGANV